MDARRGHVMLAGSGAVLLACVGLALATKSSNTRVADANRARLRREAAALISADALPAHAVIYARDHDATPVPPPPGWGPHSLHEWHVIWQPVEGTGNGVVVYIASPRSYDQNEIPTHFGFVPSPDGRWLCVWETSYDENSWYPVATTWTAVELPEGRRLPIHAQRGLVGYLPFWIDEHRLLLEKGGTRAVFDVRTGKLCHSLPTRRVPTQGSPRDVDCEAGVAATWRQEYVDRHYGGQIDCARGALSRLGAELRLSAYLGPGEDRPPETLHDFLLRAMGLVAPGGSGMGQKLHWPSIAVSPDCTLLARAAVLTTGETTRPDDGGNARQGYTFEARIDVFDLCSSERLWATSLPWTIMGPDEIPSYARMPGRVTSFGIGPYFQDVRWSRDGRYLSFSEPEPGPDSVVIVDVATWTEIGHIADATNAFVVPLVERRSGTVRATSKRVGKR